MLIDTHAHLNFSAYKNDADEVIRRCFDNNIWVVNVGSQFETSQRAVKIAEKYPAGVYAAIGLHPIHLNNDLVKIKNDSEEIEIKTKEEEFDCEKYRELAKSKKVVAIGEIGFDYYWKPKTRTRLQLFKDKQKEAVSLQLKLAEELNLPVIFHCRLAHQDLLEVLNFQFSIHNLQLKGAIHCFTGNWEQAERYLEKGLYLGFNGLIFKLNFDEIIKKAPLERILIETDCPYLTPPGACRSFREGETKGGRNEPLYIKDIAQKIAEIKNIKLENLAEATTENARKLFNI